MLDIGLGRMSSNRALHEALYSARETISRVTLTPITSNLCLCGWIAREKSVCCWYGTSEVLQPASHSVDHPRFSFT